MRKLLITIVISICILMSSNAIAEPASIWMVCSPVGSSMTAGESKSIEVSVSDENGEPVANASVTFSTEVVESNSPGDCSQEVKVWQTTQTTDERGITYNTFRTFECASGTYIIKATSGNASDGLRILVKPVEPPTPPTVSLSLSADSSSPAPGGTVTFTVVVKKDNTPAQGETVTFSVSAGDGNASLGTTSTTTDSNGRAQTTLTLGDNASGSYTVAASVGSKSAEITVTTVTVEPRTPTLSINTISSLGSGSPGDTLTFTVEVQTDGSPTQGETVTFSVSPNDGNVSLGTTSTTTGSDGRAETTVTLGNSASGSYTVTAAVGTTSTSTSVNVQPRSQPRLDTDTNQQVSEDAQQEDVEPSTPVPVISKLSAPGQIGFSELMIASKGGLHSLSQWIELYNNSETAPVNLMGWTLEIEARDADGGHRHVVIPLEDLQIPPNQTALIVTWNGRNSGDFPEDRIYRFFSHHSDEFEQNAHRNRVLGQTGFYLKLSDPDGTVSDVVGNLDGDSETEDEPAWELPSGTTEDGARTSLMRRYNPNTRLPLDGNISDNWVSTSALQLSVMTYWGRETDIGNPGYRGEGALPVTLSHFRAERLDTDVVVIEWATASELDNAGFNILRSQSKAGPYVKVNPALITGAGTTSERHAYIYRDSGAHPNIVYFYQIEDVSFSGVHQRLATVRMRGHISAAGKITVTWGGLKTQH